MLATKSKIITYLKSFFIDPARALSKAFTKVRTLYDEFRVDQDTRAMIAHNKKLWAGWVDPKAENIFLVEMHGLMANVVANLYFANIFARKKKARIVSFGRYPWKRRRALHSLYKSWNVSEHLGMLVLNSKQKKRRQELLAAVRPNLKTKQDVFNLTIEGIKIGIDVYDTYLREFNKATVCFDKDFDAILEWAITVFVFWSDYLKTHKIIGISVSHNCYLDCNILNRLAYKMKIPVYIPSYIFIVRFSDVDTLSARFLAYPRWFNQMTDNEKYEAISKAKNQIEKRLRGEFDENMAYVKISAYKQPANNIRILRASDKLKVLICSHCFYDSPQSYGGMLFHDFHEWLSFLAAVAKRTNYDWYLKTHPDPLPGTLDVIRGILGKDSPITIIPSTASPRQLVKEGLSHVLTVYGSVGHEYPLLGVQVVNAGHNPHVGFDFTWTPKNLKEYEMWLLNLSSLYKKIDAEEVYKFYYMNYYYCVVDNVIFPSEKRLLSLIGTEEMISSKLFSCFLKEWSKEHHREVVERIENYVDSNADFLFLKGPINLIEGERIKDPLCASLETIY